MRRVPRVRIILPVTIDYCGSTYEGQIANLGIDGAFIALPQSLPISALASLKFFPYPSALGIEVLGRVVCTRPNGMGTEFIDLDSHTRSTLWDFLAPLFPVEIKECPYCDHPVKDTRRKICQHCQHSLDFRRKDYYQFLETQEESEPNEMIGTCESMRTIFHLIRKLAATDVPILITGASGTGKEMVAQAIHERSPRNQGPFVAINCGAIPRELLESQLFGYEKGAFTGAYRTTPGTLERANGGSLLLDEVGELPLELQVKLLRFLQNHSFERVGGRKTIKVDLRVISATNSDLRKMIAEGRFREDLYYRLDVVNIELPSLKDRGDDALIMSNVFLKRYANKVDKDIRGFTRDAVTSIQAHPWPGNIRELINRIRRSVVMSDGPWVTPEHLGLALAGLQPQFIHTGEGLKEAKAKFESYLITEVLKQFQGNVQLASKALRISRSMMYHLIQKYDLKQYAVAPPTEGRLSLASPELKPMRSAGRKARGAASKSKAALKVDN